MTDIYQTGHGLATLAPSGFWAGILLGRSTTIWIHKHWSARTILLVSTSLSILASSSNIFWLRLLGHT